MLSGKLQFLSSVGSNYPEIVNKKSLENIRNPGLGFYKNVNGFLWVDNYFPQKHGIIHLFSTRAIFSLELRFLTPWYAYVCAYQGVINVNFSESKLIKTLSNVFFVNFQHI